MAGNLVSSWFNHHSSVPESFVQPPERRPGHYPLASSKLIPVIDLGGHDRADLRSLILKSLEEFGLFQVINHGVAKEVMDDALRIFKEFHELPTDEKIREGSRDPSGRVKLYTSSGRNNPDVADYWKDTLSQPCPPSGELIQYWPDKPVRYREVIRKYTEEVRKLGLKILELIAEGLGLNPEHFSGGLSENPVLLSHCYPPCPNPSLTLGASKHRDPNILTVLLQESEITALEVFKDGERIGVEPIPDAFVINVGSMLQIVSNGRMNAPEHHVVTNSSIRRHTIVYFINPTRETLVEPAKPLISSTSPPLYPSMTYAELMANFLNKGPAFFEELKRTEENQQK